MLKNILSQSAFWVVNKKLARELGVMETILLSDLIAKEAYFQENNMLTEDGFFFNLQEDLQNDLDIGDYKLRQLLKVLVNNELLEIKKRGNPSKNYYKIKQENVVNLLLSIDSQKSRIKNSVNHESRTVKITELNNNNKNNNNKANKKNYNKKVSNQNDGQPVKLNVPVTKSMFDLFWKIYPRKINEGSALSKWEKLCKKPNKERPTFEQIKKAIEKQKKTKQWQNEMYIPHPSTWLNNYGWLNDYESGWDDMYNNVDKGNADKVEAEQKKSTKSNEERLFDFKRDVRKLTMQWDKDNPPVLVLPDIRLANRKQLEEWSRKIYKQEKNKWRNMYG